MPDPMPDPTPNPPPDASDEPTFFERVWEVVGQIPHGKVTTYGDIAGHLGSRGAARTVGWALKAAIGEGLPCHRVVNRFGALTGRRHFEGPRVMEERLRNEGVAFTDEGHVDLEQHHWTPSPGGDR
jgi:O-6-methylguanine DNA methyltransferase